MALLLKKIMIFTTAVFLAAGINLVNATQTSSANIKTRPNDNVGGISIGKVNSDGTSNWKIYTEKEGLLSPEVPGLFVSEDARSIYAAHWSDEKFPSGISVGTIKDDGSIVWKTYSKADGIGGDPKDFFQNVTSVFVKNNTIYAGTLSGLAIKKQNEQKFTKITFGEGLLQNMIQGVFIDDDNTIYAASNVGLYIKKADEKEFKKYTTADGLINDWIFGIFVDKDKTIYASTYGGLSIGKEADGKITWKNYCFTWFVRNTYVDNNHVIYVALEGQNLLISRDNGNTWEWYHDFKGNHPFDVTAKDGVIYVAAGTFPLSTGTGGLAMSRDNGETWKQFTMDDGLSTNATRTIQVDKNHTIYLGGFSMNPTHMKAINSHFLQKFVP